jgi:hypothetical protein
MRAQMDRRCLDALVAHAHGERHHVLGVADLGDGHARGRAVVGLGGRVGRRGHAPHGLQPRERVAAVAAVDVALQVALPVALHQRHLVPRRLARVVVPALVDVPQQQPARGQVRVAPLPLPVLHQKILRLRRAVPPQLHHPVAVFHVREGDSGRFRGRHHVHPPLVRLAPRARHRRILLVAVVAPGRHEAPHADALGGVVRVVEVRPVEGEVAELVRADAELAVARDGEVGVDLGAVGLVGAAGEDPLVGPDVGGLAGALRARAGVDDHERVDVAVAVVVVFFEGDFGVGEFGGVEGHELGVRGGVAGAVGVVGVVGDGLGHAVGADDLARDGDGAVGDVAVVVFDAVGAVLEPEARVVLLCLGGGEFLVGEVDHDHDHVHGAAQRCALLELAREGQARAEGAGRAHHAVVVPHMAPLHGAQHLPQERVLRRLGHARLDLVVAPQHLSADLRRRRYQASLLVVRHHRGWHARFPHRCHNLPIPTPTLPT